MKKVFELYYEIKEGLLKEISMVECLSIVENDIDRYEALADIVKWFPVVSFNIFGDPSPDPYPKYPELVGFLIEDENGDIVTDDFWGDSF